ncbi:MAG: DUF368 domain-containing protein [Anaerolineaceae bacterium]|nr:DUF368 domain-containing protein [Anaerolineaceae bacterium]MCY4022058.1 DUF368 domain-containing protein [Anaerolineaceae bacterium]
MLENNVSHARPRSIAAYARLFLTGCAMGAADLVPGVSGGTMAFVLGVYQDLLDGIRSFNLEALRLVLRLRLGELERQIPLRFLLTLWLGILTAIFGLAGFLSSTLEDPVGRVHLFAFFFGLVLASIVAVGAQLRRSPATALALLSGALVAFAIVNLVPADTEPSTINLFLAGMVAVCAMILPGISGSFILLILGQYDHVLRAASERDFGTLFTVAAGSVVGIVIFSRLLGWLLRNRPQTTIATLVGFMIGSLWKIWPWKACIASDLDRHGDYRCLQEASLAPQGETLLPALLLMLTGFAAVTLFNRYARRVEGASGG